MERFTFVSVIVSLCILSSGLVNASEQLQIIFNDGTSQTVNLNKPANNIKSINFQGDQTASSQGAIAVVAGTYGRNCGASYGNKTEHLASACNNRTQCEYIIDYLVLGDPVVGCGKDYVAEWRCGNDATTHRTSASPEAGFKKQITLTCPR
jgi:hypothetical protein